jgi:hypothetical protein
VSGKAVALGLEVWLIGTRAELAAAYRALSAVATVAQRGDLHRLPDDDEGRFRTYLRLQITSGQQPASAPRTTAGRPAPVAPGGLFDAGPYRKTRQPAGLR